jgi:hypothetical protein
MYIVLSTIFLCPHFIIYLVGCPRNATSSAWLAMEAIRSERGGLLESS